MYIHNRVYMHTTFAFVHNLVQMCMGYISPIHPDRVSATEGPSAMCLDAWTECGGSPR